MRHLIIIALLALFAVPVQANTPLKFKSSALYNFKKDTQPKDAWIARDKGMHFAGSFIITGLSTLTLRKVYGASKVRSVNMGVSISLSLGVFKEIFDSRQPRNFFSYKDLAMDVAGTFLAYLVFRE